MNLSKMVMGTILWLYFSGEKIHWTIQESVYVCGIGDEAKNGNKNWRSVRPEQLFWFNVTMLLVMKKCAIMGV